MENYGSVATLEPQETAQLERVPGEIVSTEIAGSNAPLLLSIKSQQALGLVVDFAHFTVYSRLLDLTFKAVKGRKNGLIDCGCYQVHPLLDQM